MFHKKEPFTTFEMGGHKRCSFNFSINLILSTCHKTTAIQLIVWSKMNDQEQTKPDVMLDYNIYKTGVDQNWPDGSIYTFKRKQMK